MPKPEGSRHQGEYFLLLLLVVRSSKSTSNLFDLPFVKMLPQEFRENNWTIKQF